MRRTVLVAASILVAIALVPVALAAGGTTLKLSADKALLKYDKSALTAKAGKVTIVMTNPSMLPHNVAIKGGGVKAKGAVVNKGGVSTVSATLKAGKYTYYCTVPGHEAAGMKGVLTVK
jgi:plastocyanin